MLQYVPINSWLTALARARSMIANSGANAGRLRGAWGCFLAALPRVLVPLLPRQPRLHLLVTLTLRDAGVELVSCTEYIDATASGEMTHGIFAVISEFYSRNLSNEVKKGLRQKAIAGGTPTRAPIGYFNIRRRDDNGHEYRTVDVDPARAPLVAWAFEAYATGEWTLRALADELTLRGLTTVPTPKRPAKAIAPSTLQSMLRNPYYTGIVMYNGARHPGVHDPLVNQHIFSKVQQTLDTHRGTGDRQRKHAHPLKGMLCCQCGAMMSIELVTARNGETYPYFYCLGRHRKHPCGMRTILVSTVEQMMEDHYRDIALTTEIAEALEDMIGDIFDKINQHSAAERQQLAAQRQALEDAETKLIHLYYDDMITHEAMKKEQGRVATQLAEVTDRLEAYQHGCDDAKIRLKAYLALAANCWEFYRHCDDTGKRLCNEAFFTKITISEDHRLHTEFTGPYDTILDPEARLQADYWQRNHQLDPTILEPDGLRDEDVQGSVVRISRVWWS